MPTVIKYGGNAMTDSEVQTKMARSIGELARDGQEPVVVHGGGPVIAAALECSSVESHFVRGLRVTTAESLAVIEGALLKLNKRLAQQIGGAIGLSGRDNHLLVAEQLSPELGFVGRITDINTHMLKGLLGLELTPVIACLAEDEAAQTVYNVNADSVAGAVAGALASPVIFLTDVLGVLDDYRQPESLLGELSRAEIEARVNDGRIAGGMIPKVEAALTALDRGAAFAVIADGRNPTGLAAAVRGEAGTRIVPYRD